MNMDLATFKMVAPLGVMFAVKKLFNTEDPYTIQCFRAFFVLGQLFLLSCLYLTYTGMLADPKQTDKLMVSDKDLKPSSPLEALLTGNSNNDDAKAKSEEKKEITVGEYDYTLFLARGKQVATTLVLIPCVHWYFGLVAPLVMSTVVNCLGLLDDPLIKLHLFADKSQTRPFPPPKSPFDGITQGLQQQANEQKTVATKVTSSITDATVEDTTDATAEVATEETAPTKEEKVSEESAKTESPTKRKKSRKA